MFVSTRMRQQFEISQRQGPAEQVALVGVAALLGETGALGFGFHAFGNHGQAQALAEGDNRTGDGGVVGVGQQVAHEGLIDLQVVKGQPLQVGQGFARYEAELGRAVIAELLIVAGYFTSVSLAMSLHALQPKG